MTLDSSKISVLWETLELPDYLRISSDERAKAWSLNPPKPMRLAKAVFNPVPIAEGGQHDADH